MFPCVWRLTIELSQPNALCYSLVLPRFRTVDSGTVHIYLGTGNQTVPFVANPSISITSPMNYATLGFSLTSGDVDGSGHDSLIIGSPFASTNNTDVNNIHVGVVAIFRSSSSRLPASLSVTDADILLEGESSFSWFGYSMTVYESADALSPFPWSSPVLIIGVSVQQRAAVVSGAVGSLDISLSWQPRFSLTLLIFDNCPSA